MIGTEEQPNVNATIRDQKRAKSILDRVQLFFGDVVLFETFDVFVLTNQFHSTTTLEEPRVIHEDIASHLIVVYAIPRKNAWSFDVRMISSCRR